MEKYRKFETDHFSTPKPPRVINILTALLSTHQMEDGKQKCHFHCFQCCATVKSKRGFPCVVLKKVELISQITRES